MDRIDRQIVHCLQQNGRASFRVVGEVLSVSEQTVARRYRAMRDAGVLRVNVLSDAWAADAQNWFIRMLCRPGVADALADVLAAREDVSWVSVNAGGGEIVCVARADSGGSTLLHRLPRSNQVLSFSALSVLHMFAGGEAEWLALDDPLTEDQRSRLGPPGRSGTDVERGRPRHRITEADAPLLAELARDGRAGTAALARATGWPASRVSSRLAELLSSRAVYIDLDFVPEQFGFRSVAYLWLTVVPAELHATGLALSAHPETAFAAAVTGSANLMTSVACRNAAELYEYVTTKVGGLPAIQHAEVVPVIRRVKQGGSLVASGRLLPVTARTTRARS